MPTARLRLSVVLLTGWARSTMLLNPLFKKVYNSVKTGNEAQISIDSNSKPDYREKLEAELKALRESEMWQTAVTVRKLRPENN